MGAILPEDVCMTCKQFPCMCRKRDEEDLAALQRQVDELTRERDENEGAFKVWRRRCMEAEARIARARGVARDWEDNGDPEYDDPACWLESMNEALDTEQEVLAVRDGWTDKDGTFTEKKPNWCHDPNPVKAVIVARKAADSK